MTNSFEASPDAGIPIPFRKLEYPDPETISFDVYATEKMFLAKNMTSNLPNVNHHWPDSCLDIGWEKYYSDDYNDTNWCSVESSSIVPFRSLILHPATCALHYAPSIWEGTKALQTSKGKLALFRPELNAKRLQKSAARLLMPKVPIAMFMDAVTQTSLANRKFVPEYEARRWRWETRDPRCLYIRPLEIGHGPQLGVRPSKDHLFMVYSSPVRAYYPIEGIRVLVTRSFHRAAPKGTGDAKSASNYVSGLLPTQLAKRGYDWIDGKPVKISEQSFHDVLYLDPLETKYIEEFSGANFFAVTTDGTLVSPQSNTILPGITRKSVWQLAEDMGMKVERRPLDIDEVMDEKKINEVFCTGNAAIVTPINSINHKGKTRVFNIDKFTTTHSLWDQLIGIQMQTREDPYGWVIEIGEI